MAYEDLTLAHFEEWGSDMRPQTIFGLALRNDAKKLIAIGGIWFFEERWWAIFDARGTPPRHVHKAAIKVSQAARQAGVETVWAVLDNRKPRAQSWLERFGFVATGECDLDGHALWRLEIGRPGNNNAHGRGNRYECLREVRSGPASQQGGQV